ncbi:MAG: hypothetical protein HC802_18880 [Caldilineaceae bacterium]|nr:hypothetical protein [Caldilineaceae bacterium]
MHRYHRQSLRILVLVTSVFVMVLSTAVVALAGDPPPKPVLTMKPVLPPRRSPPPIPHSMVLNPDYIYNQLQDGALRPQSSDANTWATKQKVDGKPGVLKTVTETGAGLTLYATGGVCNDFNVAADWHGEPWTSYYAGWGSFAADDGYYQAKNVTFDLERSVGPGKNYGKNQASMKIASNQPYDAGVMSPAIKVKPGQWVKVRVKYLVYNHDSDGMNYDYASMGIIPRLGQRAIYTFGYHRGEWAVLEQEVRAHGDEVVVMLQGHSPAALNSNIYFDDVQIWIEGEPVKDCKG